MRLIDADFLVSEIKRHNDMTDRGMTWATWQVIELLENYPLPPNDPLTLEELREMDGEPVWVVEINGYPPRWGLVYWCRKNKRDIVYVTINNGVSIDAETFMAAGGKIYRRKPEEGDSIGS